jgi:hypothetical protein
MTLPESFSLTRLFIAPYAVPQSDTLTQDVAGGILTSWDAVSFANTVAVGPVTYRNLPVCSPNGLTRGPVLLLKAPGGYIILGNLGSSKATTFIDPIRYRSLRSDVSASTATLSDAGVLSFLLDADTQYGVDGVLFYTANGSTHIKLGWTGPANMAVKWNMAGDVPTGTDDFPIFDTMTTYGDAATQTNFGFTSSAITKPSGWFSTTDTGGLLTLRFAQSTANATPTVLQTGSWLRISELGAGSGTTTFVKQYPTIASRSYDSNGNFIGSTDGDNNVYFGQFPDRSFGNERSLLVFDGATIRADLASATILSARMWLYCFKAEETNGSFQGIAEPYAVLPTTYNPANIGFGVNDLWTVPSWNSMECYFNGGSSSYLQQILAGDNAIGLTPTSLGRAATGFRGFGFGVGTRPYLEITYAV